MVEALKGVSLSLPSKGFIGLSGENGCGKSTLLNLLSTVDLDFEGSITIDNLDVKKDFEYIRKNVVSYVFQEDFFIPDLSVKENIEFYSNEGIINDSSNIVPIEKLKCFTNELSGGQKQKVSILRALQKKYDILLVDEPTSSLDEKSTKLVFEVLSKIAKNKLVILVSHDKEMMNAYCNLIVYLNDGNLENVKDNNTVSDVIYTDTGVIFNGDINLIAIDSKQMNEIVFSKGKFIIEKGDAKVDQQLDYSINNHTITKDNDCSNLHKKIIQKSLFKGNKSNIINGVILLSIFVFILQMFIDFASFNYLEFAYKTINENQDSYVICKQLVAPSLNLSFDNEELDRKAKQYQTSIDYNDAINTDACFDFDEFEYYKSSIEYVVYTDFSNYDFIVGNKPSDNSKIAITDYIADALIKRNDLYSNYDDVLSKGIYLENDKFYVSGIIDSSYKKYNFDDLSAKEYIDFNYYQQHLYSSIFYLNGITGDEYAACHISMDDLYVTIIITNEVDSCKVNSKLASVIEYNGEGKASLKATLFGYIEIDGIKDDSINDEKYIIYAPENFKNLEVDAGIQYFMTNISNIDFFAYLNSHLTEFFCYSYTYANITTNIISGIRYIFIVILSLSLLLIWLIERSHIKKANKVNNNLYCLSRLNGDSLKIYSLIEIQEIGFVAICTTLINFILYFGGYALLNFVLTKIFRIDIVIFMNHFKNLLLSYLAFIVLFALIYLINYLKRKNRNILKMIK